MKTYTIKINKERFMWSIERAEIGLTSPSGKTISVPKSRVHLFTTEERKVWDKLISNEDKVELTIREMELAVEMSGLQLRRNWMKRLKNQK